MRRRVVHKPEVEKTIRPRLRIERYLDLDLPDCALVAIGRSQQSAARPGIALHAHNTFEFSTIRHGQLPHLISGGSVLVDPGQLLITRPNQRHGCPHGVVQPCTILWLQVDHRKLADRSLRRDLEAIRRPILNEHDLLPHLHALMLNECARASDDPSDVPRMINALLAQYLALVIRQAKSHAPARTLPDPLARVVAALQCELTRRWTLTDMQQCAGIRHSRLSALFQHHLGQSPSAYALRLRLAAARAALAYADKTITEIALHHGFSSAQHFATAFRMHFGETPQACRASAPAPRP